MECSRGYALTRAWLFTPPPLHAGRGKNAVPKEPDFSGRVYPARILLLVDSEPDRAARGIGFPDRALLPVHPHHSGALHAQTAGHSLQLDVPMLRSVHCGLRRYALDGGLDDLVSYELARPSVESRDVLFFRCPRDLADSGFPPGGSCPGWTACPCCAGSRRIAERAGYR